MRKKRNSVQEIEGVALDMLISVLEDIREERGLSGVELMNLLDEKGTSKYMNDTSFLFGLMHEEDDTLGVRVFTGEMLWS